MITSPQWLQTNPQERNTKRDKMSPRQSFLHCHSLRRVYQPGADVSRLLICALPLFTHRDVSDIIRPRPPHTHSHLLLPLSSNSVALGGCEPHKISLKTTRSAEANLWGPFILITTLWKRLFQCNLCYCVLLTWLPSSRIAALHEKRTHTFLAFFLFCFSIIIDRKCSLCANNCTVKCHFHTGDGTFNSNRMLLLVWRANNKGFVTWINNRLHIDLNASMGLNQSYDKVMAISN